jgi:hypothetical protein
MNADATYHWSAWVLGAWAAVIATRTRRAYRAYFAAYAALQLATAAGFFGPLVALSLLVMHAAYLPAALGYLQPPAARRDRLMQAYVAALSFGLAFYFLTRLT